MKWVSLMLWAGADPLDVLAFLTRGEGLDVLRKLLKKGLGPNDQDNGGCSAIQHCLTEMSFELHFDSYSYGRSNERNRDIDNYRAREQLKAIHILAKHGAKWIPPGKREMDAARRSLLRMKSDYTVEFVWIMSMHRACSLNHIQDLLRTPRIKSHISAHRTRIEELLEEWR